MSSWIGVSRCCSRCRRYGIGGHVREHPEVELGDHAVVAVADLPAAHLEPVLVHLLVMPYGAIISCVGGW